MRYPALRVIVVLHYIAAVVIAGVLGIAGVLSFTADQVSVGMMLISASLAALLILLGFAEVLRVIMDIEENTRPRAPDAMATTDVHAVRDSPGWR